MRPTKLGNGKYLLIGGQKIQNVHLEGLCIGEHCCIHNPSNHHMIAWDMNFRNDRGIMERICPEHGIGHPDPDDPTTDRVHGCCGCCNPENKYATLD